MAMQLRSGRRLASPVPAPAPRGDLRRVRPRRSQDDGGDDDGEDRFSSLPKEMRLEVLGRLPCLREAMRTSVLSETWRDLWTELGELTFDDVTDDVDSLLGALAQVQPKLDRLCIEVPRCYMVLRDATSPVHSAASISSLLHAADRLEPLSLVVRLRRQYGRARFVLPCFARATSVELKISRMRFKLPPAGIFASLEKLALTLSGRSGGADAGFVDPGVLVPRCPRLRSLIMDGGRCPRGVTALAVESASLQKLVWHLTDIEQHVDVRVVAPNLAHFAFSSISRKFTMSLSAPKLEKLDFQCFLADSIVGCAENQNQKWRLYELQLEMGPADTGAEMMECSSSRHAAHQHALSLYIHNVMIIPPVERSFAQEVARLPGTLTHFSALELHLRTDGHVFGALVLQLLRIRTTIRRLKVVLLGEDTKCWAHCDCDFASNWRNELISLPHLEVAEFKGFRGDDHEMDFLKLLYESAPSLDTMMVQHFNEISIVNAARQKLHSMFSAHASVKFFFS